MLGRRLAAFVVFALVCGCDRSVQEGRPSFILITIDTTRADHIGCYGHRGAKSPQIDALAEAGVRFSRAIAQSATTPVSCASLLTGSYPYQHGLRSMHGHKKNYLRADIPTIQGALHRVGYQTAAFVSAFPAGSRFGFARDFEHFDELFLAKGRNPTINQAGVVHTGNSQQSAGQTTTRFLSWLRKHDDESFFVWLHYFDPHDMTLVPPGDLVEEFTREASREGSDEYNRLVYDAEIAYVDSQIREVVTTLDDLGLRENTILIITADHGQGLGDHDWWGHGILYQEQIRVPLVFNGPQIASGGVVDRIVELVDLFSTILELAQQQQPDIELAGTSLVPFLRDPAVAGQGGVAYSESHNLLAFEPTAKQRRASESYALIRDGSKLIHYPLDPTLDQLYDLSADPHELNNQIDERRELADNLLAELRARGAIDGYVPDPSTLSEEEIEHLRVLGYLE